MLAANANGDDGTRRDLEGAQVRSVVKLERTLVGAHLREARLAIGASHEEQVVIPGKAAAARKLHLLWKSSQSTGKR